MTRASLRDNVLVYGGYTSFFLFAFILSAYRTFPYERLRDYICTKVAESSGPDPMTLSIGELTPSWLTGVKLEDVTLQRPAATPDAQPTNLHFDKVSARVSLLSLLLGSQKLSVAAEVGDGTIDAKLDQDAESQHVEAELTDVDLQKLGLGGYVGVPLKGKATGTATLTLAQDPLKSAGEVKLEVAGLHVGDGKAKIKAPGMPSGLTLDEVDAGKLQLELHAQDGNAELTRFYASGKDLKVEGSGNLRIAIPTRLSRLDVILELKFSDAYKNKSDRTKALFEILGMQSEWRRALGPDGALRLHVGGTLGALRAAPSSVGPGKAGGKAKGKR
jgi:type II secretion system protein N